jgi:hypothetical protein
MSRSSENIQAFKQKMLSPLFSILILKSQSILPDNNWPVTNLIAFQGNYIFFPDSI